MNETVSITFRTQSGDHLIKVRPGHTLMEAAREAGVPGIIGECGGSLSCGTCHVRVVESPSALPDVSDAERDMLEFAEVPATEASRLCCQIVAAPALDGLIVEVAEV